MKMKDVCRQTGLTDRAVRYYIEEGLISPAFSENYLGRKTFSFSESDVSALNEIAVLRKFGFSIAEVRDMYAHPEGISGIVAALVERKECAVLDGQDLLRVLKASAGEQLHSVSELASTLSKPAPLPPLPAEDDRPAPLTALRVIRSVGLFAAVWAPVAACMAGLAAALHRFYYPVFSAQYILLALLALLPSVLVLLYPRLPIRGGWSHSVKAVLITLCVLSIPVGFLLSLGTVSRSETSDFRYYRRFDPDCLANRSALFQELFPQWPRYFVNDENHDAVYLDAHYFYRYLPAFDYTYDVYAEWPLDPEDFDREVSRARAVFSAHAPENDGAYGHFVTLQRGNYRCLVIYNGSEPFAPAADSYTYCIFAYNEVSLRVRYLFCDSLENGADQPFYLTLSWD